MLNARMLWLLVQWLIILLLLLKCLIFQLETQTHPCFFMLLKKTHVARLANYAKRQSNSFAIYIVKVFLLWQNVCSMKNCHFGHFSLELGHSLHSPWPTPMLPVYFFKMFIVPSGNRVPLSRNFQSSLLPSSLLGLRVYFWSLCSRLFLDVSAEKMNLYLSLCVCPIPLIMCDVIHVAAFGRTCL